MKSPGSNPDVMELSSNKRPHSPAHNHSASKRIKPEPHDALETDFTTSFSDQPSHTPQEDATSPTSSSTIVDPCGFCTDGTPCICAEMQAAEAVERNNNDIHDANQTLSYQRSEVELDRRQSHPSRISRISQLSHITPPPSDTDVSLSTFSVPPYPSSSTNPCINGPGTCLQCRSDPNSTLFCKSLARSREQKQSTTSNSSQQQQQQQQQQSGCCGSTNTTTRTLCCQSTPETQSRPFQGDTGPATRTRTRSCTQTNTIETDTRQEDKATPILLTCADAYTTLSRHPGYAKATAEMAGWLPRLHPMTLQHRTAGDGGSGVAQQGRDRDGGGGEGVSVEGRPAMEIDAANVMAVLRGFDRRFT
jgi:hypothetical protein